MANTFLRNDGWFQPVYAADVGVSTSTSTALLGFVTKSTTANIALSSTGTTFDGPSVSQGSSGVWLATGNVTFDDTAGTALIFAKLWDGTTAIDSGASRITLIGTFTTISLSGVISSPAGNIRISAYSNSVNSLIVNNASGSLKDTTITAIRIG